MGLLDWLRKPTDIGLGLADLERKAHDDAGTLEQYLSDQIPFILDKEEVAFLVVKPAVLMQVQRSPGKWVYFDGRCGFGPVLWFVEPSFKAEYVPWSEMWRRKAWIPPGTATITSQRVVFTSGRHAREWKFSNLLSYQHDPHDPVTVFQVSNYEKTSGVGYPATVARMWRARLSVALACYRKGSAGGVGPRSSDATREASDLKRR
jgi:hypothetical protein